MIASVPTSPGVAHEPLAHERLDAYHVALDLLRVAHVLAGRLPRTKGQLGDQLQRAAESVVLRVAEAAGAERRSADQKRSFRAARGSALECAAVFEVCRIRRVGTEAQWNAGRSYVVRLVQMLTRLSQGG